MEAPISSTGSSYQRTNTGEEPMDGLQEDNSTITSIGSVDRAAAQRTLWNFVFMSVFFSANHGCVVACLSLATSRLGSTGAWQSGILYLFYTASALLGATYVAKSLGARNAIITGMMLYCVYVGCFLLATISPAIETPAALFGAGIGGVGAGFLWTAQGSYFARASEDYSSFMTEEISTSTSTLASIFAFIYLSAEIVLRSLSTFLLEAGLDWVVVFAVYTAVTILSTLLMFFVHNYSPESQIEGDDYGIHQESTEEGLEPNIPVASVYTQSVFYKVTAAWQLLKMDLKMKYMIPLNAVFAFAGSFLNSYVNSEVVKQVDNSSTRVGIYNAWVSCVAAGMSLVFGQASKKIGNGPVLIFGAICFSGVVLPFLVLPNTADWGVPLLLVVYTFHGTGRATFEGTLKATFADYFAYEKEGAFANIILQNGLSGAIGYVLTFTLLCSEESRYCIKYSDGSLHNVFIFEALVAVTAILAVAGYLRASALRRLETISASGGQESLHSDSILIPLAATNAEDEVQQ